MITDSKEVTEAKGDIRDFILCRVKNLFLSGIFHVPSSFLNTEYRVQQVIASYRRGHGKSVLHISSHKVYWPLERNLFFFRVIY